MTREQDAFSTRAGRTAAMSEFCRFVRQRIPEGYGCAVLVFEYIGPDAAYVSTAARDDMIRMLRETADRLERREDFHHQERN